MPSGLVPAAVGVGLVPAAVGVGLPPSSHALHAGLPVLAGCTVDPLPPLPLLHAARTAARPNEARGAPRLMVIVNLQAYFESMPHSSPSSGYRAPALRQADRKRDRAGSRRRNGQWGCERSTSHETRPHPEG